MGSVAEWHCRRWCGCYLSTGDQRPHCPRFLWPGSLAQTAFRREEEALGGVAPDLPVSEPGWRYAEPDHPRRRCLGVVGERDPALLKHPRGEAARSWRAQRSPHIVPALLKSKRKQVQGGEVGAEMGGLDWLSCLQGTLHTQSGTCASALQGHTLQHLTALVFAWFCHCFVLFLFLYWG